MKKSSVIGFRKKEQKAPARHTRFQYLLLCTMLSVLIYDAEPVLATLAPATVTVANTQVGRKTRYDITFVINTQLDVGDEFNVVFPNGTVPSADGPNDIKIRIAGQPNQDPNSVQFNGLNYNIRINGPSIDAGRTVTLRFKNNVNTGVTNPLVAGSYKVEVSTSQEPTLVESNAYEITSNATLTAATVIPTSSVASAATGYNLDFTLGGAGAMTAAADVFTVLFPDDTTVPEGAIYGVTVNGTATTAIGTAASRRTEVQTPLNLANLDDVTLSFSQSSGLVNPSIDSTYTLDVFTSVETDTVSSSVYSIFSGTDLTPASVILTPNTINAAAQYQISASLGATGGLTADVDTIFITLPSNTIVPGTIATGDVTVNNDVYPANPTAVFTNPTTREIKVVPSVDIENAAFMTVTFQSDADVTNPTVDASYTLDLGTTQETAVTSNSYVTTLATTTITEPVVTLSNSNPNAISTYTFNFNVGAQGRLLGGTSKITVSLPGGTTFPNSPVGASNVTVNGLTAASTQTQVNNRRVIITTPSALAVGNNDAVEVIISGNEIRNPANDATVTATLSTSVEQGQIPSANYKIGDGATHHVLQSVTLGDNTVNTTSTYTFNWRQNTGSSVNTGDLITLGFPFNTILPATISTNDITIDPAGGTGPTNPTSVTANPTEREIEIESPFNLPLNQVHVIDVEIGAGVINPSLPGSGYIYTLRTTDASVEDDSPGTVIAASNNPVTFPPPPPPHVTVSPDRELEVGGYTINFRTGAEGALLAGLSTITFTFPAGTVVPSVINGSSVTVNGTLVSSVAPDSVNREITLTTPVAIAGLEDVAVVFATAAGIVNPAADTTHTLDLITAAQIGVATSNTYTITSSTELAVQSVFPDPTAINANAGYVITFQLGSDAGSALVIGDQIIIDFPDLTGVPGVMAASDVRVNNTPATIAPFTDTVSKQVTVTTPVAVSANGTIDLAFTNAAGLINPPTVDQYTLNVSTNKQMTPRASPAYSITAATTTVTPANVTPSVGVINQLATYYIDFNVGAQGGLQAGVSTITIVFNDSTTVPASFQTSNVTVEGQNPPSVNVSGQTVTITVPNGVTINNNDMVSVVLGSETAVITNPSVADDYTVTVNTSVETTAITSLTYPIGTASTTVTPAVVTPTPDSVDDLATSYTVNFDVGGTGALTAGASTVTIIFPDNTTIPFSIPADSITVNGTPVAVTPSPSPLARSITFTTPVAVANDGNVDVIFKNAGLRNPSTGGSYTLQVHTSVEPTKVTSQAYTITAPLTTVTPATVTPVPAGVNSAGEYTIDFNVGGSGALQAGVSTITLVMPVGTDVPSSIATSKLTVNGTNAAAVVTSGQQIVITVPSTVTIPNSGAVTLVIAEEANMINPQIEGQYTLDVQTSAEPTLVASNPYTITGATTTVTAATVNPNPATVSVTAEYTIDFNVGASGALQGGASTITFTLNNSTTVATTTISGATINGVAAQAVSDAASRTVVMTVPPSVTINNNDAVTAFIPLNILTNPGTATNYTLDVKTSVEETDVTSSQYIIGTASSTISITAVDVFADNKANDTDARTRYTFSTGADGALTGGSSTITTIFPDNTVVPSSIATTDIEVDGVDVQGPVTINTSTRTVTFTVPNNIAASQTGIQVDFKDAAALTNPSGGSYTLQARTSSEPTNIASPSYSIVTATTQVSAATVNVSPNIIEQNAAYTITFAAGSQGRLLAGSSKITITFPASTTVPGTITPSTITVNGVQASVVSTADSAVTITVPVGVLINSSSSVVIVFNTGAGLFNPPTATSYQLTVHTDSETTPVNSNNYSIVNASTQTTTATVIPNPGQQSVSASYTYSFNTGGQGALQGGVSTITTTFPSGTTVPGSILASNVTVNGTQADNVATNAGARTVTTTLPTGVDIDNNTNVTLIIGSSSTVITNPTSANYTAQVHTSVETTHVTTNSYFISNVATTVDSAFVGPVLGGASPNGGPSPQTVNTVASYNIKFALGGQGDLTPGTSTITLTFPANTTVPTGINQNFITVNTTALDAAPVTNATLRTITMTVPSAVPANSVEGGDTVTVDLSTSALLVNPTLSGTYRLDVRTSVEATNIPSKLYTILDATTQVTQATVTPTPDEFDLNAQYRIDFSVGGQGALLAGTSTITITFPVNTEVTEPMDPAEVTINGVDVPAVVADSTNRTATLTVPSAVNIVNNGSVSIIFKKDALLVNPNPGSPTLDVRTSVETPNRTSNAYLIKNVASIQSANKISLYPIWQPSDKRLAYITEAPDDESGKDTGNWNLFTVRKNGRQKTQVTSAISGGTQETGDPIHYSSVTWTPDGDSLVYTGFERIIFPPSDTVLTLQLYQISRNGGTFKKISPFGAVEDTLSQFGGWLDPDWKQTNYVFESATNPVDRIVASLDGNIWVFEPRSEEDGVGTTFKVLVQITNLPTASGTTDGLFQPRWSPDRRQLAVVYKDSVSATRSDIYVISNVDSIIQKTLESDNYGDQAFDYDTEVGAFAVNDLSDMTKLTTAGNNLPSWTPSWSADGTQVAYSQDQSNTFSLDTFSTSPATSVASTNFYVKMRPVGEGGTDSTLVGVGSANNAFPTMANNGQRFGYFQAATTGPFLQKQKIYYLQSSDVFDPPSNPKILSKQQQATWKLTDLGYSSLEFPVTAVNEKVTFFLFEPEDVATELIDDGRYVGVVRHFGPTHIEFFEPATVTVHYTDAEFEDADFVAGSEQEEMLSLYYFDPSAQAWEKVEDSTVDTDRNLVSAPVMKLGAFGVFYTAPAAGQVFSQIMVYPNPFKPNSGSSNDGDYGTGVILDLLPLNLDKLDIYNIAGEWVASKDNAITPTGAPGQWRWRGTNDAGRRVASGVYIYVMEAGGERKIGKIAVIR